MSPHGDMLNTTMRDKNRLATSLLFLSVTSAVAALSPSAFAQDPPVPPFSRVTVSSDAVARINPLGLALQTSGSYRHVSGYDTKGGYETSYQQAGASLMLTPAYAQPSVEVEWLPVAFAAVRVQYAAQLFMGANRGLLRFPSATSAFGEAQLKDKTGSERSKLAHRVLIQPLMRAKLGPVVLRNQTDLAIYRYGDDGPYLYESEYDTLLAPHDLVIANRTQVMLSLWRGQGEAMLLAGPFYEVVHARDAELTRQRVGAAVFCTFAEHWIGLRRPRAYGMSGVNASDPNRQGQGFLMLGLGADLDF